jgi:hypothetical protein
MKAIKRGVQHFAVLFIFGFVFFSCDSFNFNKEKPSKNLLIENEVEVATESIPTQGGILVVNAPGSQINGMTIKVNPNSYSSERTFKITEADITSHSLGTNFNPITPLIQIENGGGYAEKAMEVTIPINLPEGHFAMGFVYDEMTGTLEGIPVKSLSANSITLETMHFMSGSELRKEWDMEKSKPVEPNAFINMVVASVSESVLEQSPVINSGFTPGTDDWEFVNYGSYIAPGGHCAGQSMTCMWYYYEKKLRNEPPLYNLYNLLNDKENPGFMWQDNPLGYRFSSVIQNDFDFTGWVNHLQFQSYLPSIVFKCFAASMLITGEPQYVLIRNSDGKGGHAMVVYKVDYSGGKLYIADPNYPNNYSPNGTESIRIIQYRDGKLQAYETGLVAGGNSLTMDEIGYFGKTTFINWGQIGKRYNEVLNHTIGSVAPNAFPDYTIIANKNNQETELHNDFSIEGDTLRCFVVCPSAEMFYNVDNTRRIKFDVYDQEGQRISVYERAGQSYVLLEPGLNILGFYIYGWRSGHKYSNGDDIDLFVDFHWLNIYKSSLSISPNPIVAEPKEEIIITASSMGTAPQNARYVWDFGDGSKPVTVKNDSIVEYKYSDEGEYTVKVELFDQSSNKLVGTAFAEANIASGILGELHKCQWVSIDFNASIKSNNDIVSFSMLMIDNSPPWGSEINHAIQWNGTSFHVSFDYTYTTLIDEITYNQKGTISGEVSANGNVIKNITATYHSVGDNSDVWKNEISAIDIPYDVTYEYNEFSPRFSVEGPQTKNHILSYDIRHEFFNSVTGEPGVLYIVDTDYNDPDDVPYIHITFSGMK